MKKIFVAFITVIVAAGLSSCSKGKPSDVLEAMQKAYASGSMADIDKYYTKGTVEAINELNKLAPKSQKEDNKFAKEAAWDVVQETIKGDTADVKIKYTKHPVENMKGFEMTFHMKKEDGSWKIDMEKEMQAALSMIKAMNKTPGMADMLKKYMK